MMLMLGKRNHRCMKKEVPNVYPFVLCKYDLDFFKYSLSRETEILFVKIGKCNPHCCARILNCTCHLGKPIQSSEQENISALNKTSKSKVFTT